MKTTHIRTKIDYSDEYDPGAITIVSEKDSNNPLLMNYGVSFCNKQDQFVKKFGNHLAKSRLYDNTILRDHDMSHKEIVLRILADILIQNQYPMSSENLLMSAIHYYSQGLHK